MSELILYPQLSTRSRRAILKTKKSFGHPYRYQPRGDLLERLARTNGMTKDQVYMQLLEERQTLLRLAGIDPTEG